MYLGTMGAKGHVQVIIPFETESYASQADPPEKDVPYCTLKSFPATMEHCIIWARDKFENLFVQKPHMYTQFWKENRHPQEVLGRMQQKQLPENCVGTIRMLEKRVGTFKECVQMSRIKFERYFCHKARDLRNAFPDDQKLEDGTLFWASPKRKPEPIGFNIKDETHIAFILACAKLLAFRSGIHVTEKECELGSIVPIVEKTQVPVWKKSDKKIETDESKTREETKPVPSNTDIIQECINFLARVTNHKISPPIHNKELTMEPNKFEKDDDKNSHIDFITAASNLRAQMYIIETADRLKIKRIAGRIVPAIATTTAAVSGLVALELIKIVKKCKLEDYKNCFMSLAVPTILFSEPGPVSKTEICPGLSVTLWDKWEVRGHQDFTIKDFITDVTTRFKIKPTMIVQGVKMVYVPMIMPGHSRRFNQPISKYIVRSDTENYVDLVVTFDNEEGDPIDGPPIRYFVS